MPSEFSKIQKLFKALRGTQICSFPKLHAKLDASKNRGVYVIMNSRSTVEHVGSTPRAKHGIQQRLRDHLSGRSSFTRNRFSGKGSKLREGFKYRYLEVRNQRKKALLEAYAIAHLCPKHIGLGEKEG
jgi:hypothetical protein